MSDAIAFLSRAIEQGRGLAEADIVLKGGRIFDLVSGELVKSDVAICDDRIVGTMAIIAAAARSTSRGKIIVPGFIDTHCMSKSSLITPLEFDRCVLARGVTTAICDPHEIANVLGVDGHALFPRRLDGDRDGPPRATFELRAGDASRDLWRAARGRRSSAARRPSQGARPRRIHEFSRRARPRSRVPRQARRVPGPADRRPRPLLRGLDLNGYLAAGIRTDHEMTNVPEALEKLSKGMQILVREGSVSKDLHALAPIITERNSPFIAFCTDDRNPLDIAEEGHLDYIIRTAISARRAAARRLSRREHFRCAHFRAAGPRPRRAGLARRPRRARRSRELRGVDGDHGGPHGRRRAVRRARRGRAGRARQRQGAAGDRGDFAARGQGPSTQAIGVVPGKIITDARAVLPFANGLRGIDLDQDLVKVAVVARHGINDNIAVAFVHGFGMKRGAIASSVGHDSHNITVVGADEADMAVAVNRLIEIEGGFAVAEAARSSANLRCRSPG